MSIDTVWIGEVEKCQYFQLWLFFFLIISLEKYVLIKVFILQIVVFFMVWTTQFYS